MEIAISTASLYRRCYTEEAVAVINSFNKVNKVEVFLATFSEYSKSFGKKINKNKGKLQVHSVHALTNQFEPDLYNLSLRTRGDSEKILRNVLETAEVIGAKYYTFHGPFRLKNKKYNLDYKTLAKRTNEISHITKEYGVTLTYENVHWTYFSVPEYFKNLSKYLDDEIGVCLDIKQAKQAGLTYKDFLPVMKGRIKTVHLCDYDENRNLCMPGRGIVDFVALFRDLADNGYSGPIILELYPHIFEETKEIIEAIDYLNCCLEKAQN